MFQDAIPVRIGPLLEEPRFSILASFSCGPSPGDLALEVLEQVQAYALHGSVVVICRFGGDQVVFRQTADYAAKSICRGRVAIDDFIQFFLMSDQSENRVR